MVTREFTSALGPSNRVSWVMTKVLESLEPSRAAMSDPDAMEVTLPENISSLTEAEVGRWARTGTQQAQIMTKRTILGPKATTTIDFNSYRTKQN
jgi:hypothetical protein